MREVVILFAMRAEAAPLIRAIDAPMPPSPLEPPLPMQVTGATIGGQTMHVVTNGIDPRHHVDLIGTQPATLAADAAIRRFRPDLLISAGTCGGFHARGGCIGDVYLSRPPVCFHDRRIAIPGFDRYGVGGYPSIDASALASDLGFKLGVVSSGNALDMTDEDRRRLADNDADVKDMEAAAVAWVCELHRTPFLAVKAVTDLVDTEHPTEETFLEHLHTASEALTDALRRILARLVVRS